MVDPSNSAEVAELICRYRPDRYESTNLEWAEPAVLAVAQEIDPDEARFTLARQIVHTAERVATQRTNRMIREMHKTGEIPLDWMDAAAWPLGVDGKSKVALRALTSHDLVDFATVERRRAAAEFVTRNETCTAAEGLAEQMDATGAMFLGDLVQTFRAAS